MAWKRQTIVRSLSTKDGTTYPSFFDSWLTWRDQLTTKMYWDSLTELIPDKKHWEWTREDVANAFSTKLGKEPNGSCPQCNDIGRITARTAEGAKYEIWCMCHVAEWVNRRLITNLSYSSPYISSKISDYDITGGYPKGGQNGSLVLAKSATSNFIRSPSRWLVLSGSKGLGKTKLLRTIATVYGPALSLYIRAQDFVNQLMEKTGGDSDDLADFLNALKTAPILLIDDVGAEYRKSNPGPSAKTPYALSKLTDVIDHRYANPQELPVVITTNESQQTFQSDSWGILGDRFTDVANTIVGMTGSSYRQSEKRAEE